MSLGGFVPKPFTPFQWFGQNTREELDRKIALLREDARKSKGVQLKWHETKASLIEGLMSRGDRRMGAVIEHVWREGGIFQECVPVVVHGEIGDDEVFAGDQLEVKHSNEYEAENSERLDQAEDQSAACEQQQGS